MKKVLAIISIGIILSLCGCKEKQPQIQEDPYKKDANIYLYKIDKSEYSSAIADLVYYSGWDADTIESVIEKHKDILTDSFINNFRATVSTSEASNELIDNDFDMEEEGFIPSIEDQIIYEPNPDEDGNSGLEYGDEEATERIGEDEYDDFFNDFYGDNNENQYDDFFNDDFFNDDFLDEAMIDNSETEEIKDNTLLSAANNLFGNFIAYALETEGEEGGLGHWYSEEQDEDLPVYSVTDIDAYPNKLIASVSYRYGAPLKVVVTLVNNKIDGYVIYR